MASYLSLPRARILALKGWGKVINSKAHEYRVELADHGLFIVYGPGRLREKPLLSIPITRLELATYAKQLTEGVDWVGGGFGIRGAVLGATQAKLLNQLTTQTHEYTVLRAQELTPNGARREILLGFRNLIESDLRDNLLAAAGPWSQSYITTTIHRTKSTPHDQEPRCVHSDIDQIQNLGLIDAPTAATLHGFASQPFVDALLHRLHADPPAAPEAQRISTEIEQLHAAGQLTQPQAQQLHNQLTAALQPPPRPAPPTPVQRRQIQTLITLHDLGAMSDAQFEAEKARLLDRTD